MADRRYTSRSLDIHELDIPDVFVLTSRVFADDRGEFVESYREDALSEVLGRPFRIAQTNHSVSHADVVRGVHSARVPPGQAKIVSCLRGEILDVSVDLRVGSPTFGRHLAVRLRAGDPRAVLLGEGIGHAFLALRDDTLVQYQCSTGYVAGDVIAVDPLDPDLALPFAGRTDLIMSRVDAGAPSLTESVRRGLLPFYEDCRALTRQADTVAAATSRL
ncbi:dTDP-4-dehydrorhamnose 3,5-epimerase family protein [Winogradskya humida]|uniref:dTDP-4-dehydrorhamnose 3,5-epimerase n=1 Tax=Winogradskya humida TaxID=113566 RepID=A0ABQ3ZH33_9ACTN|nr:dTDP-4-dehydrorhamnose 3,5-epimerase [Actinoplanes humidus]GIE17847.1 dTDP-4-dehydrorhamnose 3,5-epimerase [Actinoplanes humidus]